jgi:hypothetical protein
LFSSRTFQLWNCLLFSNPIKDDHRELSYERNRYKDEDKNWMLKQEKLIYFLFFFDWQRYRLLCGRRNVFWFESWK